jgi:hypothetical protein
MKTTFALLPRNKDGTDFKLLEGSNQLKGDEVANGKPLWEPTSQSDRDKRFSFDRASNKYGPDHYDIQLLQVSTP